MKIHVCSDLHIEFDKQPTVKLAGGDTLLLAGDVCVADHLRKERTDAKANKYRRLYDAFFNEECAKYDNVYFILGNHDQEGILSTRTTGWSSTQWPGVISTNCGRSVL